ncbi:tyrosine protein kinase [Vagococcus sp. DIV0080]|uniref:Capsular polysaccharide biosynthesis protein CpsC n=1 Tax=Candidatus Vagococcus giribetii TaxID=2230876 RepID=A0ABS3HWC9_9ENTE|nr:Wzz/FepE/Etk N-terminal domain-containing protein [Vagococcus sp. DIV0080]MBO0477438.1 tyrosine protein kinase [Vagococcus sp. DIV0080]
MEETVSLQEIFSLLKKKATLILSMFFIGIGISAIITLFFITPKYSATSQLIATSQNKDNNVSTDNINSNLMMINTYKDFIKGKVVMDTAREQLEKEIGFKGSSDDIKNMISVEQTQSSQMFSIVVTSEDPKEAATVANVVASIFKQEAGEYTEADKVSIISEAEPSSKPVSPNKKVNMAIGGVLGLIVGVGLALLSQLFNRTVKSPEYVTETVGIPILGHIPLMSDKDLKEIRRHQASALKSVNLSTESIDDTFNLDDGVDGLDQDLSRISEGRNLEDTIDLSELKINHIDLDDMGSENNDSVSGISRRSRTELR